MVVESVEEAAQRRLAITLRVLSDWRPLLQEPIPVQPGSSLAADDEAYPEHPASQVAWAGIASAIDHLDLLISSWRATGNTYPNAHRSVARQALVGGAQAVWVLGGPTDQRIGRGLRVVWDDLRSYEGMLTDAGKLLSFNPEMAARSVQLVAERKVALKEAGGKVGLSNTKLRNRPTAEEMVDEAARHVPMDDLGIEPRVAFRMMLRQQNGFSHALRWSSLTAVKAYRTTASGLGGEVRTSLEDLMFSASGGMLVINQALHTFRSRATA